MKKPLFKVLCVLCMVILCSFAFVGCEGGDPKTPGGSSDGGTGGGNATPTSFSVTCDEDNVFGDYYDLHSNYLKVGAGETVTVTVESWDFLSVKKVFANNKECTAASGKFTFTMPSENVVVTAEFDVVSIPETADGLKWVDKNPQLEAGSVLNTSLKVDFGDKPIINSVSANDEGYATMLYAKVISTNQNVIPSDAIRRIEPIVGSNGAYAIGAYVSIDATKISRGETTLIFIDTDNDRAITIDVTVN